MATASRQLILISLLLAAAATGPGKDAKVLHVADGDTIKVRLEGREEMVRLLCIDTPERGDPGFKEAGEFLAGLIDGKTVGLDFEHPDKLKRDGYGRVLAYIWRDAKIVNVEVVRAGWSRFWDKNGQGKYAEQFKKAEAEARKAKRGLWASSPQAAKPDPHAEQWCASKNSKVYHPCSCPTIKTIKPENIIHFNTEQQAKDSGRVHCQCEKWRKPK